MRLHRFYIPPHVHELEHHFWLRDERVVPQWLKVLRFREGQEVVLFDGVSADRLYKILQISGTSVELELVTEFERKLPLRHVYLLWALLKKDKNDWVMQKATELGVSNFVPIVADRSEKTGFNVERAQKILIEAAEQCGRSDIPAVREPIMLDEAIREYQAHIQLFYCDERTTAQSIPSKGKTAGVLIGPEGGWTPEELHQFTDAKLDSVRLGTLTLRAETAAVVAATKFLITNES